VKRTDLIRYLQENGCALLREGGSHSIFINEKNGQRASVPRHREIKHPTSIKICRQLEIPDPPR
jgi:predicted RNA binding protein YcfA (HicA-like mRNA interferase family)